nr:MAG: hypothetical protein [Bacteriophage sp.]
MSPLEIISRLCDVTNSLSEIVKEQQTIIEHSKVEEAVKRELRGKIGDVDEELDVIEYHSRRYADIDDIEAEMGKGDTVDD